MKHSCKICIKISWSHTSVMTSPRVSSQWVYISHHSSTNRTLFLLLHLDPRVYPFHMLTPIGASWKSFSTLITLPDTRGFTSNSQPRSVVSIRDRGRGAGTSVGDGKRWHGMAWHGVVTIASSHIILTQGARPDQRLGGTWDTRRLLPSSSDQIGLSALSSQISALSSDQLQF